MENIKIITTNLQQLTKNELLKIGQAHRLDVKQSMKKKEIVDEIGNVLEYNFKHDANYFLIHDFLFYVSIVVNYYSDWYEKDFIDYLKENPLLKSYKLEHKEGQMLFEKGYLLLITGRDKQQHIIIHKPLNDLLLEKVDEMALKAINNEKKDFFMTALANLYGCYSLRQFLHIWNKYNQKDKMIEEQAIAFCDEMNKRKVHYWFNGNYIIHRLIDKYELDELLEQVGNKPYYTPTMGEIEIYAHNLIDKTTAAYKKIAGFFNTHKGGLNPNAREELIFRVATAFKFNSKPQDLFKILNSMHYNFEGEKTLADFNNMLNFSANNTRKWVNRGATPKELFEQFEKPLMKDLPKKPWK